MKTKEKLLAAKILLLIPICDAAAQDNLNINTNVTIGSGDSITNSTVSGTGTLRLNNGASATAINVESGGTFEINNGATAEGSNIQKGGLQSVAGIAINSDVAGVQNVSGTVINTNINGGGQAIYGSGTANNTTLNGGGQQYILGTANDTNVNKSSLQQVQSGGLARNTTVNDGGWQQVLSGGLSEDAVINQGGLQSVNAEGSARNTTLNAGASQTVSGYVDGTQVNGGTQSIYATGTASNTTLSNGGQQYLLGAATDTTVNYGSRQQVQAGGIARNTTVNGGWQQVLSGGLSEDAVLNRDGLQSVNAEGSARNTTLNAGASQTVSGNVDGTQVNGGTQSIYATGTASNTTLSNGGEQYLLGTATDTTVNTGSLQQVQDGGIARITTVNDGGWQQVLSGGSAIDSIVNQGGRLLVDKGGTLAGTTTLYGGAILSGDVTNHALLHINTTAGSHAAIMGSVNGNGQLLKDGDGTLTVSNGTLSQSQLTLRQGRLELKDSIINSNIVAQSGTSVHLSGSSVMNGAIDPTDVTIDRNASWNIQRGAPVKSIIENLDNAGTISFKSPTNAQFVPETLIITNLAGRNGTINMSIRLDDPTFMTDMLVIDGGKATGRTWLNFTNIGDSGLGLATTGSGIKVVDAINGATTDAGAFALSHKLQAGVYNYTLSRGKTDESWYLANEAEYRAEVALYSSLFAQSMDYDRTLAGTYSQRSSATTEQALWMRVQGGHIGHGDNGGIAQGFTPKSSGSYGFTQLGSDLLKYETDSLSLVTGIYAAAGKSSVHVKNDDLSSAGKVHDTVYSFGAYLTTLNRANGQWADISVQNSRHSLKANSDSNNFDTRGSGWLTSLESGFPLNVAQNLVLEPQVQYIWQSQALNNGHDSGGYVDFGDGHAQHVRAGIRLGNLSEMNFGKGTSVTSGFTNEAKHKASELPINWWIRPSVIRTFSANGKMNMGTTTADSNVSFTPSQNGTSLDFQAGITALVRENIMLGVQGGYSHNTTGSSAEGYNAQATLKVSF